MELREQIANIIDQAALTQVQLCPGVIDKYEYADQLLALIRPARLAEARQQGRQEVVNWVEENWHPRSQNWQAQCQKWGIK